MTLCRHRVVKFILSRHKVFITNIMKISNSLVVLAYDDEDDEEDARN